MKKGSKLYIEGQLQTRKWTDKDNVEKYSTEVVLQNFNGTLTMLDSANKSGGMGGSYDSGAERRFRPVLPHGPPARQSAILRAGLGRRGAVLGCALRSPFSAFAMSRAK